MELSVKSVSMKVQTFPTFSTMVYFRLAIIHKYPLPPPFRFVELSSEQRFFSLFPGTDGATDNGSVFTVQGTVSTIHSVLDTVIFAF